MEEDSPAADGAGGASALGHLRVLEIGDEKGVYCGKLLADLGAEVIRLERPGGDALREIGPFAGREPDPERGLLHLYGNTNKRSLELDLGSEAGRERFRQLARSAHLLVDSLAPGQLESLGLGHDRLARDNPALVHTCIAGFGCSGPWRDFATADIVASAAGGALFVTGEPEDPPVLLAGRQACVTSGTLAAASSLIALRHAARSGRGQRVDISMQEAVAAVSHVTGVGRWREDGVVPTRTGSSLTASCPCGAYRCSDGLAYLMVNRPQHWTELARWIREVTGNEEVLQPQFEGPSSARAPFRELIDLFVEELTQRFRVAELFEEAQRRHIALAPVNDLAALLRDPQLAARDFFVDVDLGERGALRMPGAPAQLSLTPWQLRRPAPRLGEGAADLIGASDVAATLPRVAGMRDDTAADGALGDLRVVELGAGMAGPWAGRIMAFCGAEVVKIESHRHPDVTRLYVPPRQPELGVQSRLSPWFTDWNAGKRFIALDLAQPEAVRVCRDLIAKSDVVIENYSTDVLPRLGLGPDVLRALNPGLVHLRSTGYGSSGPYSRYVMWGPNVEAHAGLAWLSGHPHRPCTVSQFAYPDCLSALHGLFAVLAALVHRDRTGVGQTIDLSQVEVTACAIGERVVEQTLGEAPPQRLGNRSQHAVPQGVYACAGDERWIALSISDDRQFAALGDVLEENAWPGDARFASAEARRQNADALDTAIARWSRALDPYEAMHRLQAAGVPASVVESAEDQAERDPQLAARRYFEHIDHALKGEVVANGIPVGLTRTPGRTRGAGAAIGQDNEAVLRGIAGLSADEYARLLARGAIEGEEGAVDRGPSSAREGDTGPRSS